MSSITRTFLYTCVVAIFCARCVTTTLTVPGRSEEALNWCGAAAAQSIMESYPASPCTVAQVDVWTAIQTNKVESSWDSDPQGIKTTMAVQCPASWSVFSRATQQELMYSVAHYMKLYRYPVALLLATEAHNSFTAHQEHWVTVKEIVTTQDPTTNSSVDLQWVSIIDQPGTLSTTPIERVISGSNLYATELKSVTTAGSSYAGKYVAVIEPPLTEGLAVAPELPLSGDVITLDRAIATVAQFVGTYRRSRIKLFRDIARLRPQPPVLVNQDRGGYYLVPFAKKGQPASMALLVNAYNGAIMEAGRFAPTPAMSQQAAIAQALRVIGDTSARTATKATLVSAPQGGSPYYPVWRVQVGNRAVVVSSNGAVVSETR